MLSINTNLSSLIVQSNLKLSTSGLNTAIERMTTGFKINRAKDFPVPCRKKDMEYHSPVRPQYIWC